MHEAVQEPYSDIVRDAVIQRFEYVFELSWKFMQTASTYMGTPCRSPRESIRSVFKLNWIQSVEGWLEAMEARNKTSHTYNEKLAQEIYKIAVRFPALVNDLLEAIPAI